MKEKNKTNVEASKSTPNNTKTTKTPSINCEAIPDNKTNEKPASGDCKSKIIRDSINAKPSNVFKALPNAKSPLIFGDDKMLGEDENKNEEKTPEMNSNQVEKEKESSKKRRSSEIDSNQTTNNKATNTNPNTNPNPSKSDKQARTPSPASLRGDGSGQEKRRGSVQQNNPSSEKTVNQSVDEGNEKKRKFEGGVPTKMEELLQPHKPTQNKVDKSVNSKRRPEESMEDNERIGNVPKKNVNKKRVRSSKESEEKEKVSKAKKRASFSSDSSRRKESEGKSEAFQHSLPSYNLEGVTNSFGGFAPVAPGSNHLNTFGLVPNSFQMFPPNMYGMQNAGNQFRHFNQSLDQFGERQKSLMPSNKYESWLEFFLDCRIPEDDAVGYAEKMEEDEFSIDDWMLLDDSCLAHLKMGARLRVNLKIKEYYNLVTNKFTI